MDARIEQMLQHGVPPGKFPYASFCYGRGWQGHLTIDAARTAAARDARRIARQTGGGEPQHLVADTATGKSV